MILNRIQEKYKTKEEILCAQTYNLKQVIKHFKDKGS